MQPRASPLVAVSVPWVPGVAAVLLSSLSSSPVYPTKHESPGGVGQADGLEQSERLVAELTLVQLLAAPLSVLRDCQTDEARPPLVPSPCLGR